MNKLLLTLFLFLIVCVSGYGQRLKQYWEKADTSFDRGAYYSAYRYYDAVLQFDSTLVRAWFRRGESARQINALDSAIVSYRKTVSLAPLKYPAAYLWLGISQQQVGELKQARESLEQYLALPDTLVSRSYRRLAEKTIDDLNFSMGPPVGKATNLCDSINSIYSDFGPHVYNGKLYYSSLRFDPESKTKRKEEPRKYSRVLVADFQSPAQVYDDTINAADENTAYVSFTQDGTRMYYCKCSFIGQTNELQCDIYTRERADESSPWGPGLKLDINAEGATNTQPAIGLDSVGNRVLYFASDRDGGKGQMDIWYGPIEPDGNVREALPMAAINTPFDDAAPFYHEPSQRLFFSSRGHRASFGDFDLYYNIHDQGKWDDTLYHLPPPYNSRYADVHYWRDATSTRTIYSSTRIVEGAKLMDENSGACCHDLYETPIPPLELMVSTYDAKDSTQLDSVLLKLYGIRADGTEDLLEEQITASTPLVFFRNRAVFGVDRYESYRVQGSRTYYFEDEAMVDLLRVPDTVRQVNVDLYLAPRTINLTVIPVDVITPLGNLSQDTLMVLDTTMVGNTMRMDTTYEFLAILPDSSRTPIKQNASDILLGAAQGWWYRGASMDVGQTCLEHEMNAPLDTSFYFTDIQLFEDYTLRITRNGYYPRTIDFRFTRDDVDRNTYDITIELEMEPLESYTMFFDNNLPRWSTTQDTTTADIKELIDNYYARKEAFVQMGLDSGSIVDVFFEEEIKTEMSDLETFVDTMETFLEDGYYFTIGIQGFASPLGSPEYNRRLTNRRIVSILNYFREYDGGRLKRYIDRAQLTFKRESKGEEESGQSRMAILDRIKDVSIERLEGGSFSETIFSLRASIDRKVDITDIKIYRDPAKNGECLSVEMPEGDKQNKKND